MRLFLVIGIMFFASVNASAHGDTPAGYLGRSVKAASLMWEMANPRKIKDVVAIDSTVSADGKSFQVIITLKDKTSAEYICAENHKTDKIECVEN